ncbi:organic cation transporter protein [Penaeus vannamei]|uniref:Putative organic cation transporter protein-like n=1 Tax=Penaeus vannamei TaxID=6689 RepID=A0A423U508_PENVA|nr:organic cation transporter protein-like [Penaeus vannamei]ROT83769.1 putative organic cation transporter protein-like [Penaeus vannamei]
MLVVGSMTYSVLANILSWLPNFSVILALRFCMGLMHPTSIHAGYTLAMEVNQPKHRAATGILIFLPWAFCVIALGGYGYLLRDWRWLSFTLALPALLFLPALWFIDESPRWLIVRGRYDDASRVLRRAARLNKVDLPPEEELRTIMEHVKKEALVDGKAGEVSTPGFINSLRVIAKEVTVLVKTRRMRSITLSFYAQFFVLGMVYYGLSFGADKLGVDPFVYMAVNGVVEIPSGTVTIPLVERLGRRLSCTLSFVVTAGSLLVLGFIPSGLNWLLIMMALLGKLGISIAYQVVFLYACELFPTEVRVRGIGTSTILAKIGAMAAPFLLEILGSVKSWLPLVLFGVAAFLAGVVTFWLPESLTAPMMDTVAELEAAYGATDDRDATAEHHMEQPNGTTRE